MKKIILIFALALGLGTLGTFATFATETETISQEINQEILDPEEQKCFDAINKFRARYKIEPIQLDESLCVGCRSWSEKLRTERKLYHGSSGENCARGNTNGYLTFRQWETSTKGHREFMLNRNMDTGGIGRNGNYWTYRAVDQLPNETEMKTTVKYRSNRSSRPKLFRR